MSESDKSNNRTGYNGKVETTIDSSYYDNNVWSNPAFEFVARTKEGEEAISIRHTGGSSIEMDKKSGLRIISVYKSYYYVADGFTQTVDGHSDFNFNGGVSINYNNSVSEQVKGNKHVGIGGDSTQSVKGESTSYVGGNRKFAIDGKDIQRVKGKANYSYGDDSVRKYEKNLVEIVSKNSTTRVGGSMEIITTESVDTEVTQGSETPGLIRIVCKNLEIEAESITLKTPQGMIKIDGNILQQTKGDLTINVTNNISTTANSADTTITHTYNVVSNLIELNG